MKIVVFLLLFFASISASAQPDKALVDSLIIEGIAFSALQQYDSARVRYLKAIAADPGNVWAYYNTGVSYSKEGKREFAILWLKKAAKMFETYDWLVFTTLEMEISNYHYEKGNVFEQLGEGRKAVGEWRRAMRGVHGHTRAEAKLEQYGRLRKIDLLHAHLKPNFKIIVPYLPYVAAGLIVLFGCGLLAFRRSGSAKSPATCRDESEGSEIAMLNYPVKK